MQESEVKIPLKPTNLYIYGTLRGSYKLPLIVLCHGYGGWMHEMLLYNAARYFEKEGFATLRLSMYGGGEWSRDISRSDVLTHASDIDSVASYVKEKGVKWIGVVGHSYSGMAIVYSRQQTFDSAVLWDPTHTDGYDTPQSIKSLKDDFVFVDEQQVYMSGKGSGNIYAETVFDNKYPKSREMASRFNIPTCVINASWNHDQLRYGKDYVDSIKAVAEQVIIPGSSHPFTEDGVAEKLFGVTAVYFKKQILESHDS
ncbi:MAG: alpha/beta hydrolase [Candidatus Saccharimonadales bacterium]